MNSYTDEKLTHIAAVISPHGFGHAARTTAVLERLRSYRKDLHFEIFSEVPEWFFVDSLGNSFTFHNYPTDVGVIQKSPFEEDIPSTYQRLQQLYANTNQYQAQLAYLFSKLNCKFSICDISPLGLAASQIAGIPSILIENFTWDWIYEGYVTDEPRLYEAIESFRSIFGSATIHIQAEPLCVPSLCDLVCKPVARQARIDVATIREQLGVPLDRKMVIITAGGIEQKFPAIDVLESSPFDVHFVIAGNSNKVEALERVTLLPHHSSFYHPDLIFASDAVVGKLGYSTIAEAYYAGIPFAFVSRDRFRETVPLASYVRNNLGGFEIPFHDFFHGDWVQDLPRILDIPKQSRSPKNGAEEIARYILFQARLI